MVDNWESIDRILRDLLRYEEVLGAIAVSSDGLVVGSTSVSRDDAELAGALGATLVGAAARTAGELGAGVPEAVTLTMANGMLHAHGHGDVAVILFTDRCDAVVAARACQQAAEQIVGVLALV